jgi:hypothetical protein
VKLTEADRCGTLEYPTFPNVFCRLGWYVALAMRAGAAENRKRKRIPNVVDIVFIGFLGMCKSE